jgi:hypothetical protein
MRAVERQIVPGSAAYSSIVPHLGVVTDAIDASKGAATWPKIVHCGLRIKVDGIAACKLRLCDFRPQASDAELRLRTRSRPPNVLTDGPSTAFRNFDHLSDPAIGGPLASQTRVRTVCKLQHIGVAMATVVASGITSLWPDEAATALPIVVFSRGRPATANTATVLPGTQCVTAVTLDGDTPESGLRLRVVWTDEALATANALRAACEDAVDDVCETAAEGAAGRRGAIGRPLLRCVAAASVLSAASACGLGRLLGSQWGRVEVMKESAGRFDSLWSQIQAAIGAHGMSEAQHDRACKRSIELVAQCGRLALELGCVGEKQAAGAAAKTKLLSPMGGGAEAAAGGLAPLALG